MNLLSLTDLLQRESRSVVLAADDGSARQLRAQLLTATGEGADAWLEQVTVVPLQQWLVSLWDDSFPTRQVLRPVQLLALARKVIGDSELLGSDILNELAIARRFVDAFELAERYLIEIPHDNFVSREIEAFGLWQRQLRASLRNSDALSAGQLPLILQSELLARRLELPGCVVYGPGLEPAPAEQALLQVCADAGVALAALPEIPPTPGECRQYFAADMAQEVDAVARWVAAQLRSATDSGRVPSIALITPDIARYEEPLRRALERHVYPLALFPTELKASEILAEPWRIGGGRLAGYPVIATAVDLLGLPGGPVAVEQLSRVLRSSFVADAQSHRAARANLDWYWRENLPGRASLSKALKRAERRGYGEAVAFMQSLKEAAGSSKRLPSLWVRQFDSELLAAGWPNRSADDAVVNQCRRGFSQVMDTLRALDRQLGAINRGDALFWLQHILQGKRFELDRDEAPPVQILDLSEAAGQRFDRLWLMGLSDASLPGAVEPSPFLPRELLVRAAVPRCDAVACLEADRQQLQTLLAAAPELVLSCPRQNADGVEQGACSLLSWDWPTLADAEWPTGFTLQAALQIPEVDNVRAIAATERDSLRGGTGIFKAYAASPFAAFLKYRLRLLPFPAPVEGLDPATQGSWVHKALELLWGKLRSSEHLLSISDKEIEESLAQSIHTALAGDDRFGEQLKALEHRRLMSLLRAWLAFERQRPEPFEVEERECGGRAMAFGIPLRLTIDRIDRIGDRRLIIDYKTGQVQANFLNAENMREPQLPLYALLAEELLEGRDVNGIALAQVHASGMRLHLRADWPARGGKPKDSDVDNPEKWKNELAAWEKQLQAMAQGFLAGHIEHDYSLGSGDFPYDPYVIHLARAEVIGDD